MGGYDYVLFKGNVGHYEGFKFGRSGLDTFIVILDGLGDTDLNHTVLLGIASYPTWKAYGSLIPNILDLIKGEILSASI